MGWYDFQLSSSDGERGNFDLGFNSEDSSFGLPYDDFTCLFTDDMQEELEEQKETILKELSLPSQTEPDGTCTAVSNNCVVSPPASVLTERNTNISSKTPSFINSFHEENKKAEFITRMRNPNTVRKTEGVVKIFRSWLSSSPYFDTGDVLDIPAMELDNYLGSFLLSLRKHDGSEYEPDTLTSYHMGIDRYLRENGSPYSLVNDRDFQTSRQVLASKRKELKQKGKGNIPNKSHPLTQDEETLLAEKGIIGHHSSQALLNTVWLNNTMHFGLRGTDENRKLRWGDVQLKTDIKGVEYIEYQERDTKTRTGENQSMHHRAFNPKQFAIPTDKQKCPVETYKCYLNTPDSPFYLAINYHRKESSEIWFKCQPLGHNSMRQIMKKMAKRTGLTERKTNHSARKSTCTRLLHAGVAPTTIMQLTGHKNVSSMNNYATASHEMQKKMSNILAVPTPSTSADQCFVRTDPLPSLTSNDHQVPTICATSSAENCNPLSRLKNTNMSQVTAGVFHGATFNNCTLHISFGQPSGCP